jgi:hypothetical protein
MTPNDNLNPVRDFFSQTLSTHGPTAEGVGWNSTRAQEIRFEQLMRVINPTSPYSLLDYGSGYGAMLDYLQRQGHKLEYWGYDIVEEMVRQGKQIYQENPLAHFTTRLEEVPEVDYAVVSGAFNIKLDTEFDNWTGFVIENLERMHALSRKGFAFNLLTKYSDPDRMRSDLYYADPCFFFDFCKRHFSKQVAVLHDYGIYDFTVLVRKDL